MRMSTRVAVLFLSVIVVAAVGLAEPKTNPAFEKMKTLVGSWEAQSPEGGHSTVKYEVVSSGTALMERIGGDEHSGTGGEMITIYHPDGDRLVMTHYCSANNQPRMKAEPVGGEIKLLRFSYIDATNLSAPDAGHMNGLNVTFVDANHFMQEWVWREKGADKPAVFHWNRAK